MRGLIYVCVGILFGFGLSLSGMIDPAVVKSFLNVAGESWNPSLLFVLIPAVVAYGALYWFVRRRHRTLKGGTFEPPSQRPIDRRLLLGSLVFGVGWGLAGVCPGPALVHLAQLDINFALFLGTMLLGFEFQRRMSERRSS